MTEKKSYSSSNTSSFDWQEVGLGKMPPFDIDEEKALLGALLNFPKLLFDVRSLADDGNIFYKEDHQIVFKAMIAIVDAGDTLRPLTLIRQLKKEKQDLLLLGGFVQELEKMGLLVGTQALSTTIYLRELHVKRLCIQEASQIVKISYANEPVEAIVDKTRQLAELSSGKLTVAKSKSIKTITSSVLARIEKASQEQSGVVGVTTGFGKVNKITGGWKEDDFIVIAGRPGMAKTAIGLYHIFQSALDGKPAGWISGEMSEDGNVMRLVSYQCDIPYMELIRGRHEDGTPFTKQEWESIHSGIATIEKLPLYFHSEPGIDIGDLTYLALDWQQRYSTELLGIDYLQIVTDRTIKSNDEQAVNSSVSKKLKKLNQRLRKPVIALSQLNRSVESRPNKRPEMKDLRMTGQIEQDADIVVGLYRDDYYKLKRAQEEYKSGIFIPPEYDYELEYEFLKHRNGALKRAKLWCDVATNRFADEPPQQDTVKPIDVVKYSQSFPSGASSFESLPLEFRGKPDDQPPPF